MTDIKNKLKNPQKPSGPVKVGKYKVWVDRNLCIGAAACVAVTPNAYELDNESKAVIIDSINEETIESLINSAKSCPTDAIIIEDENGKRLYPR